MEHNIIGKKVILKENDSFEGIVDKLYLPADISYNRPKNLYWIKWNNGGNGICEDKDLIIKTESNGK